MTVLLTSGNKFYIMLGRGSKVKHQQYGQKSAALFHLTEIQTIGKNDRCQLRLDLLPFHS